MRPIAPERQTEEEKRGEIERCGRKEIGIDFARRERHSGGELIKRGLRCTPKPPAQSISVRPTAFFERETEEERREETEGGVVGRRSEGSFLERNVHSEWEEADQRGLPCGTLQATCLAWKSMFIKRRSRVLRRRTRQAALDKPRVHDEQLGFAILEQKAPVTAENRAFEEKQPLVFFLPKSRFMVV